MSSFVRAGNANPPRFVTVPDVAKPPLGPYCQAPPPYEPHWWLVNPFTSDEPWATQGGPPPVRELPEGFAEIFGDEPAQKDFPDRAAFQRARDYWEQNLRYFYGDGLGEHGYSAEQLRDAQNLFVQWGLGTAQYFHGRYGYCARFPDGQVFDFDVWARDAIEDTHIVIARYQFRLLASGVVPDKHHPFVPPHFWPEQED